MTRKRADRGCRTCHAIANSRFFGTEWVIGAVVASCKRHAKKRPPTYYGVSPEEAQAKRTATMQAHDAMPEELKSLGTNGEAWTPF
jgi:hypothetical protein